MKKCSVIGCNSTNPKKIVKGYCSKHYQKHAKYGNALTGRTNVEVGSHIKWIEDNKSFDLDVCLVWPFSRHNNGYGSCSTADGKSEMAHRVMCKKVNGDPPFESSVVRHLCGNGHLGCVNPIHLKWGTTKENRQDSVLHGTEKRGEEHDNSKLTEDIVIGIINYLDKGLTHKEIANIYNIGWRHVGKIHRGEIWNWLTKRA